MLFAALRKQIAESKDQSGGELELRQGSAEFEFFVATQSLDMNDNLAHGFTHLAELLAYDPNEREWLGMVDTYRGKVDDPDDLFQDEANGYFATEAVRSRFHAQAGKLADALHLLLAVVNARPDIPYLDWALDWLEPEGAVESLEVGTAMRLLGAIINSFDDQARLPMSRRRAIGRFADLAVRIDSHFDLPSQATLLVAGVLRRAGRFREGVELARRAHDAEPSWGASVAIGLIERAEGNTEAAEEALRRSREYDPDDISHLLEIGDMYFNRGEWDCAKPVYDEVLAVNADHPWALPSSLYSGWRAADDDADFPDAIVELAQGDPPNHRANSLLGRHRRYVGFWPRSSDATANVVGQVVDSILSAETDSDEPGSYSVALSALEAPSNRVAFTAAARAAGRAAELDMSYNTDEADPDPREPLSGDLIEVWRRDGDGLVPALPEPPADLAKAIGELAAAPYMLDEMWASASCVAAEHGDSAAALLSVCVHPPLPPDPRAAVHWLGRVHLAVALTLAHIDGGWEGSERRRGLYSMLLGPRDWMTGAAIAALTKLARAERALSLDIGRAMETLDGAQPVVGHWDYLDTLYWHWQDLPHLYDQERAEIHQRLVALHEDDE